MSKNILEALNKHIDIILFKHRFTGVTYAMLQHSDAQLKNYIDSNEHNQHEFIKDIESTNWLPIAQGNSYEQAINNLIRAIPLGIDSYEEIKNYIDCVNIAYLHIEHYFRVEQLGLNIKPNLGKLALDDKEYLNYDSILNHLNDVRAQNG